MSEAFQSLLSEITPVLLSADKHRVLSAEVIPQSFHEANPALIVTAYQEYVTKSPDSPKTSVSSKLSAAMYKSPYELFHDLVVTSSAAILQHDMGTPPYSEIDTFYKAATGLLLREAETSGLRAVPEKKIVDAESLDIFRSDFDKISKTYMAPNGEFVTHVNKYDEPVAPSYHNSYNLHGPADTNSVSQPLFSGLTGKSWLDPRGTVVPDPWLLSKAVGSGVNTSLSGSIKSFKNPLSNISLPSEANSQIMEGFFHPNWYTIESPTWLQYKQKTLKPPVDSKLFKNCDANELRVFEKKSNVSSIVPSIDSRSAVLGADIKQAVWFNHLGLKKLADITHKYNGTEPEHAEVDLEEEKTESEEKAIEVKTELAEAQTSSGKVKVQNLTQYDPDAIKLLGELKEQRNSLSGSPLDFQKAISNYLLKLNKLRQERYLHNPSPSVPTALEKALYKQIAKMLLLLTKSKASIGKELSIPVSKMVPVLMNDYQGTLPGPASSQPVAPSKSTRLGSLRGPQKRRSARFL